jgi:hypothetical protein
MRTILALATAVLLFAPGCGDTTTAADMPVSVMDLSVPIDMAAGTCATIFNCAKGCVTNPNLQTCVAGCVAKGSATAQTTFGALEQCLFTHCQVDAGPVAFGGCVQMAVGTAGAAGCMSQYTACTM